MKKVEQHIISLIPKDPDRAIAKIYDNYGPALFGVVVKMTGRHALSEDILQDSFIKIHKSLSSYDHRKAKLFTWLLRVVRNTTIDTLRKEGRRSEGVVLDDIYGHEWAERPSRLDMLDIKDHIGRLQPKYQSVVELFYFEGFSHKEASEQLSVPLGTVKTRLKIALRELRKVYARGAFALLINWWI